MYYQNSLHTVTITPRNENICYSRATYIETFDAYFPHFMTNRECYKTIRSEVCWNVKVHATCVILFRCRLIPLISGVAHISSSCLGHSYRLSTYLFTCVRMWCLKLSPVSCVDILEESHWMGVNWKCTALISLEISTTNRNSSNVTTKTCRWIFLRGQMFWIVARVGKS